MTKCSICKKTEITVRNKSGKCRSCKTKYNEGIKKKLYLCKICKKTKVDRRNKSGKCVNCISEKSLVNKFRKCIECNEVDVCLRNGTGICRSCIGKKAIANKRYCSVCKIAEIVQSNKSGKCNTCLHLVSKQPKCKDCDKNIGYENKSGLCIDCLMIERKKNVRKCSGCSKELNHKNKSGICFDCIKGARKVCKGCKVVKLRNVNTTGYCWKCLKIHKKPHRTCMVCSRFVTGVEKKCKWCKEKEEIKIKKKRISRKKVFCNVCDVQIGYSSRTGLCKKHLLEKNKKERNENATKCKDCGTNLHSQAEGNRCFKCFQLDRTKKSYFPCANTGCNKSVLRRVRKYCSKDCYLSMNEKNRLIKIENNPEYREKEEKKINVNAGKKYCKTHDRWHSKSTNCTLCILKLQTDELKKKLDNGWKHCPDCNTLIMKGRKRCRSCMQTDFENRKKKGTLNSKTKINIERENKRISNELVL